MIKLRWVQRVGGIPMRGETNIAGPDSVPIWQKLQYRQEPDHTHDNMYASCDTDCHDWIDVLVEVEQ